MLRSQLNGDVLFDFNGANASAVVPPLILAVFWRRITAFAVTLATLSAFIIAVSAAWWASVRYHTKGDQSMLQAVVAIALGDPF